MNPPGTEDSAFFAFAVVDELIRTLVDKGVLNSGDTVAMFERTVETMRNINRLQSTRCIPIAEEMIREYSKNTR